MAQVSNLIRFSLSGVVLLSLGTSCVKRAYNATPKIVSGELVEENDPVYLSTVSLDLDGKPACSGFVFDKTTIVTAAHCIHAAKSRMFIGVTFGSNNKSLKKTIEVQTKQALAHPQWDKSDLGNKNIDPMPQSPKNDIGVIVLSEDVPEWVKPLPVKEIGRVDAGRDVILAGYGETRALPTYENPSEYRGFLRKTKVKLAVINDKGSELVWESPAENPSASSCHGDSGGPMFYVEDDESLTIIGVTSRSYAADIDCREKGVYTDARKFVGWIKETRDKLASGIVRTNDWFHRYFTAKDGTKIALDYQLEAVGPEYNAREVWLNVTNPGFTGKEKVKATLSSYINSLTQESLNMEYAGDQRYTVLFKKFAGQKVCSISSRWGIKQDITITVDANELKTSEGGGSAFDFKFCDR